MVLGFHHIIAAEYPPTKAHPKDHFPQALWSAPFGGPVQVGGTQGPAPKMLTDTPARPETRDQRPGLCMEDPTRVDAPPRGVWSQNPAL